MHVPWLSANMPHYVASNGSELWAGRCGRKRSWRNLRYYNDISLEGLNCTTKHLSQDTATRPPGRDLNQVRSEYKSDALPPEPAYPVEWRQKDKKQKMERTKKDKETKKQTEPVLNYSKSETLQQGGY
jgi:hypothetical protein